MGLPTPNNRRCCVGAITNAAGAQPIEETPYCTSTQTHFWTLTDDPLCRPFASVAKCFSDGTETFTATDPDGGTYTTLEDVMANATPYSAPELKTIEVKDEFRNFHFIVPAGGFKGTIADIIDAGLAANPVSIQLPSEAAAVAVTSDETCSWMLNVQPCFAELESGEIVPEGADYAFIGGLKATGDGDAASAGADLTTTIIAPVEGAILTLCATFARSEQAKG